MLKDNEKQDYRYIQIPLCWLQKVQEHPAKAIDQAISFGVVYYASRLNADLPEVARQTIYQYTRGQDNMTALLRQSLTQRINNGEIFFDEENPGFTSYEFQPDTEELERLLNENPELKAIAIQNYQLSEATRQLSLKPMPDHIERSSQPVADFKEKEEARHGRQPMPMIKVDIAFRFKNNPQNLELFLAYIAIKSLLGIGRKARQKKYVRTYKRTVVGRMIGAKDQASLDELLSSSQIAREQFHKYGCRYHFDKLIKRLEEEHFIKTFYSNKVFRGICISNTLTKKQLAARIGFDMKLAKQRKEQADEVFNRYRNGSS